MKPHTSLDRRHFLLGSAALASACWLSGKATGAVARRLSLQDDPFQMGVASGDPDEHGFVLWTRLAPRPFEGGGMPDQAVEVGWEVAADETFHSVVQKGIFHATPALAHSVHIEVVGLKPDRWYFYRFHAAGQTSPVGRARTFPRRDVMPSQLRLAFASCQHYEQGFYTSLQHLAQEDLDICIHLGDYIYEGPARKNGVRQHQGREITTLEEYRQRFALYRSDPHLQAAHAAMPWLVTWDDHEFDNNYAGEISEEEGIDRAAFLRRREAAYQAYYENMPLRSSALPAGPQLRLFRSLPFGRLAQLAVLDTRQYRTDQPNGDKRGPLVGDVFSPTAEMLGASQEQWLQTELLQSPATWNVLAQQVMMGRIDRIPGPEFGYSMDQWSGYDVPRRRLLSFLEEQKIANPIVLTGDIHCSWVNDLKVDFDRPDAPVVATEFVGTSLSSGGDGQDQHEGVPQILAENPFVKFYNGQRGYVRCTVTPERWVADYRVVPFVTRPDAPIQTRASFAVAAGQCGAEQIA